MMRRSRLFVVAFMALLLSGCGLLAFLQNDSRVQVLKVSEGVYQVSRLPEYQTTHATRINSSAVITEWEPRAGCSRVTTEIGGTDKALKCSASPAKISTFGTLDVGLVRP
jgi:outer membrane biogenesis lipoprotein LolB